ncbi:MAG: type IX secretion system outer membrane channel protein PorV [Bacteroidota bacterium]
MNTFLKFQNLRLSTTVLFALLLTLPHLVTAQCFFNNSTGKYETPLGESCVNPIITAVPFLRIIPDARSGGMGDAGIALSPDANSVFYNASKLVFAETKGGFSLNFTPWLQELEVNDVYLASANGYLKLNENNALGLETRYFSLGDIVFTNENGDPIGNGRPQEFAFAASYARKLSDNFSGGFGLRYIYSDLAKGQMVTQENISAAKSVAADFSFTYQTPELTIGLAATNIGQKITYTNSVNKDFIPANLGIGVAWTKAFTEGTRLTLTTDFNKLMVPTPDLFLTNEDQDGVPDYKQKSIIGGMFSSFGDAPEGFSEEIREIMVSLGAELWIENIAAIRAGYFTEHETKGNRKYFTAGLGLKYRFVSLNGSYLVPTTNKRNPLDNTIRVSLLFDFGKSAMEKDI